MLGINPFKKYLCYTWQKIIFKSPPKSFFISFIAKKIERDRIRKKRLENNRYRNLEVIEHKTEEKILEDSKEEVDRKRYKDDIIKKNKYNVNSHDINTNMKIEILKIKSKDED